MENPWRVATNYVCGEKHFQVYRFRHPGETDHAGNREWRGGIFKTLARIMTYLQDVVFANIRVRKNRERGAICIW